MLNTIASTTGTVPQALKDRPIIGEAEHFYISSFYDLNAYRGFGETYPPLTLADIRNYMDILGGFTQDDKYRFMKVIKALDVVYTNKRNG